MEALFERHGAPFTGTPRTDAKGRPVLVRRDPCLRCGGQGGSEAWKHTGWKCYRCGGERFEAAREHRLYTAAELERLNATAAKKAANKADAAAAQRAAKNAEAEARRAEFEATYGELLRTASAHVERSTFVRDVVERATRTASLSEAQAAALRNAIDTIAAREAAKAASDYVGQPGERLTLRVTVERIYSFERPAFNRAGYEVSHIVTMRDEAGNCVVSKGRFHAERGESFTIKATVKEHSEYRDQRQTIVQRVAVV